MFTSAVSVNVQTQTIASAYHGLQPRTQSRGQAGQQLHGRLGLTLAVEQCVAEPLATQNQELGTQDVLIFYL